MSEFTTAEALGLLRKLGACAEAVRFVSQAKSPRDAWESADCPADWRQWLCEQLGLGRAFDEATAPARRAYDEATATARRAFDEAVATASRAYNEAVATARRAFDEAVAPARRAFDEAVAPARWAYDEAVRTAVPWPVVAEAIERALAGGVS
jgi:hypothetical protein